ncbi:MAG: glutamate 5-kinase [Bacteroidales bacterium]
MTHRKELKNKKRIVIKIGSSSLTHAGGQLNLLRIEKLARVMTDLHNSGKELVLVSSGAIATGAGKMGIDKKPDDKIKKQALAAIGQAELIKIYDKFFEEYNKTVAQVLLTKDGLENSIRRTNARNTLNELISMGIIPVINENDTVSTDEIEFGDNDTLSAIVATLINADLLIILSDIDGMFTSDPAVNKTAELISKVVDIEEDIERFIFSNNSAFGTGGMASKIAAARHCAEKNIDMVITNGADPNNIYNVLEGKEIGTLFLSKKTASNF